MASDRMQGGERSRAGWHLPSFAAVRNAATLAADLAVLVGLAGPGLGSVVDGGGVAASETAPVHDVLASTRAHASSTNVVAATADPAGGGWAVTGAGAVSEFDGATSFGDESGQTLAAPIVGIASTPNGGGYWLVASDGGIFTFGNATYDGSEGAKHLNEPIVGMASAPDGGGYWLVASDGGIFTFGNATYDGSEGAKHLNEPIVGMAPTPDGGGYWLVASDGGIFTFGNAGYYGSTGAEKLNKPIVGMAPTSEGKGYWLVASDGGIFTFGDAGYDGSEGAVAGYAAGGMAATANGYDIVSSAGAWTVFAPAAGANAAAPPTAAGSSGDIGSSGGHLTLNGSTYQFTGVNAYELGTDWGTNNGCGADVSDSQLDQFFASLRPNSLVRFWAFQGTIATNNTTGQLDWGPLDRVFNAAAAYGQRLIVTLTDQGGTCDGGHWQDSAWYNGGFMDVYNSASNSDGMGLDSLSYWDYMQDVVNRYKNSPALGMWEPISEAESSTCPVQDEPSNCSGHQTCPNETASSQALRHFFDTMGGEIHSLDPDHLVESGLLGGGQCGTSGSDFQYVSASPGIDVLSYHDYYAASDPIGGDQWNGLAVRFQQAAALGKPIVGGEVGIQAGAGNGCLSDAQRATDMHAKIQAQLTAGSSGVLAWDWVPSSSNTCSYDVTAGDSVLGVLDTVPLS